MNEDRGDGPPKLQGLKDALEVVINTARENDGIGLAPYNHDPLPTLAVTQLGPNVAGEPQRESVRSAKNALNAGGATSIGDGIASARTVLAAAPLPATATFDREALIVVTDGKENSSLFIDDVASSIDQRTFAIGIGTATNINVSTLQRLSGNTGGYLLLTGAVSADNQYELQKYLLQILAEVNNDQIILDPTGVVHPGGIERVPFPVTEHDRMLEAIVVSNEADHLVAALETPRGDLIEPSTLGGIPRAIHFAGAREILYRIDLPFPAAAGARHAGTWALLIAKGRYGPGRESITTIAKGTDDKRPVSYAAVVNTRSEVALRAGVRQSGHVVGAEATVDAWLAQFGAPFDGTARVLAHWTTPGNAVSTLTLNEAEPGHYTVRHILSEVGLHRIRVRADGRSEGGFIFTREATRTLYVGASSADDPANGGATVGHSTTLDCLLCSLLASPAGRRFLSSNGVDPQTLHGCCHDRKAALAADRQRELHESDTHRADK
jgi:hypothetical protein